MPGRKGRNPYLRVVLFIALVLLVYGSMNLYALSRFGLALAPGLSTVLWLWGAAMTLSPPAIALLKRRQWLRAEAGLSWVAFTWMGFLFLFCCLSLAFDLAHALALLAGGAWPLDSRAELSLTALPTLALMGYAVFETRRLRVEKVRIATPKLASAPVTIAQISDLHLGAMLGDRFLSRVTARLRELRPDIILATGDIVDGKGDELHALAQHLRGLTPPLGAYAVLGNHEYFVGLENSLRFFQNASFTVLRGEAVSAGGVTLVGVDDRTLGPHARDPGAEVRSALSAAREDSYIVLLKHQPLVDDDLPFDLQLSGHLHGGQIFPFGFFSRLFYGVRAGLVRYADGRLLYVNRGTGTWGPPMRLFAPPEITLITIEPANR